jgi:ABC-2 type transport system permease protein
MSDTRTLASGVLGPLIDGAVVAKRNLIKIKRVPDLLVFTTLSPIMFVLLFAYVFGGAIDQQGGGDAYREFLIAGIFAQTVVFGATITGAGLAEDVQKGIVDRFRTLPMSPSAVLTGRTLSDVVNNVIVLVVMSLTGLLVGWRIRESFADAVVGYLLLLVFAYAISWIMAWIGMLVPAPEVVNNASFIVVFPLTFVANTFVPLGTLPGPLRAFAEWNPISAVTQAARERFGNTDPTGRLEATSWALQHPEIYTLIWAAVILAVFVPLANAQFRRSTSR